MKRWLVWHEIEFKQVYNIRVLPNYCILWTIFDWYKVNLKMYNFNLSIKMDFFSGHQSVFHETSASRYWTLPDIYPLSSRTSILQNDLKFCEIAESWLCTFFSECVTLLVCDGRRRILHFKNSRTQDGPLRLVSWLLFLFLKDKKKYFMVAFISVFSIW